MSKKGLQYVVLHHTGYGDDHFDLMFEIQPMGPLVTFRSPTWPILREVELYRLGDHRRGYLSYEGPVSRKRGRVKQVARGTYDLAGGVEELLITFTSGTDHALVAIRLGEMVMAIPGIK